MTGLVALDPEARYAPPEMFANDVRALHKSRDGAIPSDAKLVSDVGAGGIHGLWSEWFSLWQAVA